MKKLYLFVTREKESNSRKNMCTCAENEYWWKDDKIYGTHV